MYASLLFFLLLVLPLGAQAAPPTLRLASLEWLPYVGPNLPHGGLSANTAAVVAAEFGYAVAIDYFPWKRAMQVGGENSAYAGYFPAYHTDERARQCHFSKPMGHSTVGLAYLKSQPLQWATLADLSAFKLGVVLGYSNGEAFDTQVEQGLLTVESSNNDRNNLKKLLASRVRAVVIDKTVLRYLLLADEQLKKHREQIEFHPRTLAELPLHICFQRSPAGQALQQQFNAALLRINMEKVESDYFDQWESLKAPAVGDE
ncbi:MAG TPA: transporter substrate-binding domain-containing protein [Pseudomonas sp.]|nr:transporter substrate-binding domain-containing protein [Pseudomonas sp.]